MPRHSTLQELLLAIAITCMFALPGCKRTSESSDSTMDSEQHDKGIGIESDKSEAKTAVAQISASVPLPADFPSDVFLPEQGTVSSAIDMDGMKAVNIATRATLAQVTADVEKAMQARGWKREMSMQSSANSATLIYTKDKRQTVYQMMKADNGGTQLAVRTGSEN